MHFDAFALFIKWLVTNSVTICAQEATHKYKLVLGTTVGRQQGTLFTRKAREQGTPTRVIRVLLCYKLMRSIQNKTKTNQRILSK